MNKTFFFGAYEGLRLPKQTVVVQSVPSLALRNGDLSAYSAAIKDPNTAFRFPGIRYRLIASRRCPGTC
jgi:hypothetical protein